MFIDNAKYQWIDSKWLNIDLPILTSVINSGGESFEYPRTVNMESIIKYWILIAYRYSKSSDCQSA